MTYRRSTVRKRLFVQRRGFLCMNDGAAFASQLAWHLADLDSPDSPLRGRQRPIGSGGGGGASVERPAGRTSEAPAPLLIAHRVRREGERTLPSGAGSRAESWPPEAVLRVTVGSHAASEPALCCAAVSRVGTRVVDVSR